MPRSSGSMYRVEAAPPRVSPPEPPAAPDFERRVSFHPSRLVGLLLIAVVPSLALAGVFGMSSGTVSGRGELVTVAVEFPASQRYRVRQPLRIAITNTGTETVASVELRLSTAYLSAFSDVTFTPAPDLLDDESYVFTLTDFVGGEMRRIEAQVQAQRYWRHSGSLGWGVYDDAGRVIESGVLELATLIWP